MSKRTRIEPGQKFGNWTTVCEVGRDRYNHPIWLVRCECGRQANKLSSSLKVASKKCRHPQVWVSAGDGTSFIMIDGQRCTVDDADVSRVNMLRWHLQHTYSANAKRHRNKDTLYAVYQPTSRSRIPGTLMHRAIIADQLTTDKPFVDHINGNTLDNRRCNLRSASAADNARNSARPRSSNNIYGYRGIYNPSGSSRWYARISVDMRRIHLGAFGSPHDAARAYNAAAIKYHGEFARLNIIREDLDTPA